MRGLLSSPRRRRRLSRGGLAVAAVAAVAFSLVHWSNTGKSLDAPFSDEPAQIDKPPKRAPFRQAKREGVLQTARAFLRTAVVRENVDDSWELTAPTLKNGYTRRQWATQDIPVQPYPVDAARWKVDYSWENTVGLKVALFPKRGSKAPAAVFDMELTAYGTGENRRWLVDSWTPTSYVGIPSAPLGARPVAAGPTEAEGQLDAGWLLLPLALLSLVVIVPLLLGVRGWWRGRQAYRRYLSELR